MNIGLPGAGIGGLYYLGCTAIMPIKELYLTLKKPEHKFRYRLVATQLAIAVGIIAGLFLIYQLASGILGVGLSVTEPLSEDAALFYSLLPIMVSFSLLIVILALVELVAFLTNKHECRVEKG